MAVTQVNYTGNGSTTNYSFTFPYLDKTDVKVRIDGTIQPTTAYSFANATTIAMDSAPANGAKVVILRDTNVDSRKATFYAGSAIKSEDLNDNSDQVLYTVQEIDNNAMTTDGTTPMTGNFVLGEDLSIIFEGATDNAYETTLSVADPTADRTITLPNETGTVITSASTDVIDSAHYVAGSIDLEHMSANSVDSAQYVDGSIDLVHMSANSVDSDQYVDGSIDLVHMSANSVDSDQYVDGSIDLVHMSANSVDSDQYVDGSIDGVHIANDAIDSQHYAAGSIDLEHMSANSVDSDQYVDGSIDLAHMSANSVDSDQYVDGSIDLIHMSANSVDSDQYVDGSIDRVHLSADIIDATKIEDNAVTTDHIADAELTTLAGMQSGTASILAGGTALTSTLTELNQLDGKTLGETTLTTNSDTAIPTSKAVNDRILSVTNALGGFVAIADKDNFPTSNPDPSGGAGTVVSISNAAGISVNSSGVGSLATRAGGSDAVIINGFPSALRGGATVGSATNANPYVLPASVGLQVQTTSTAHTYDYHKYLINEEDANKLSGDIQDFQERYRVAASAPTSSKDDGDLWFDTTNNKMKVYNASGSSWDDVAAPGNFFINTISSSSGTGGGSATFNGTAYRFTLSSPPSQGAQQLIISINGVIQKPNSGTSQPAEGFAVDTNDVIFSAAPASGSDYFIITLGNTVNIGTPSDNTVATAKIQNLAVTTAKIAADAVDGTKIADDAVGAEHIEVLDAALQFGDSVKAQFGASDDLQVYHSGSDGFLNSDTGQLYVRSDNNVYIQPANGENGVVAMANGAAELYYNNVKKLETATSGITVSGWVYIPDSDGSNNMLRLGDGADLKLYHDGSHSYIANTTGNLYITEDGYIELSSANGGEKYAAFNKDGAVELYHNNVLKAVTASTGFHISSGNLSMNDNQKVMIGSSNDIQIYHDGSHSYIKDSGTGNLIVQTNYLNFQSADGLESTADFSENGAVRLYYDGVKKFETTSTGTKVTGRINVVGNYETDDDNEIRLGSGNDLKLYHDGSNSRIKNSTGSLWLQSDTGIRFTDEGVNESFAAFYDNGACELYYDGSKKFETISAGVQFHGYLDTNGNNIVFGDSSDGDTNRITMGAASGGDLRIYHNGSDSYIDDDGTGQLRLCSSQLAGLSADHSEYTFKATENGAVELYYDGSKKLATTSSGVQITGKLLAHQTSSDSDWTSGTRHVLQSNVSDAAAVVIEHSDDTAPYGLYIDFSDDDPDNNTRWFAACADSSATRFRIYSDGDAWTSDAGTLTSDQTLKENITDATSKLEDLKKIKVRNFNWKSSFHPEKSKKKQLGFIAQEVEQVFPSLISEHDVAPGEGKEGHVPVMKKAIKDAWAPILVKALQEAIAKIETLETKVAALEAK